MQLYVGGMPLPDPYIGYATAEGGYRIVAKIGEGSMGAVYRAVRGEESTADPTESQRLMPPEVAVKILHTKYALEREFVERFLREVRVLRRLRHPNTVRIIEDGRMDDGSLFIVMELLHGQSLGETLRRTGPMPMENAIPMTLRVAYALEEAHRLGIIHRDLKPENIFLAESPNGHVTPKLLDFGLAKMSRALDSSGMSLTQEGDILGTPAFMSPEQAFGESLDGRADIYSLAVILYETLTGALPFEDRDGGGPDLTRYLNEPIPIDQRVDGLTFPPGLWAVLSRALQKHPEDRHTTALEFAAALEPFNTVQLSIMPPSAVRPSGAPVPPAPAAYNTPIPPSAQTGGAGANELPRGQLPSYPMVPLTPLPIHDGAPFQKTGPVTTRPAERKSPGSWFLWVFGVTALVAVIAVAVVLSFR